MRRKLVAAGLLFGVVLVGCGSSSDSSKSSTSTRASTTSSSVPIPVTAEPAGPNPSEAAVMVCADEVEGDISEALGVAPTEVTTPTWNNHLYSCRYVYPNGVLALSVKDLSSAAETTAYFDERGKALDRLPEDVALGEGAFHTKDGSFVVRKDYKVLEVNVSKLPKESGELGLARDVVARNVGEIIMGCWVDA